MKSIRLVALSLLAVSCTEAQTESALQVFGGSEVKSGSVLKSVVSLQGEGRKGHGVFCTGIVVSDNLVLTAGHCNPRTMPPLNVEDDMDDQENRFKKLTDTFEIGFGPDAKTAVRRRVTNSASHPTFEKNMRELRSAIRQVQNGNTPAGISSLSARLAGPGWHDIALLKFEGGIPENFQAANISIGLPLANQKMSLAGFGVSNNDQEDQGTLKQVDLDVVSVSELFGEVELDNRSGRGACKGDSGGPIFINKGNIIEIFGVASRNKAQSCRDSNIIYTLTQSHKQWILDAAKALGGSLAQNTIAVPTPPPAPLVDQSPNLSSDEENRCIDGRQFESFTRSEIVRDVCRLKPTAEKTLCTAQCNKLIGK